MGRIESLTAWALGRTPYDEEVLYPPGHSPRDHPGGQQYNDRGHPKNPETRRREREHVRAANEVMQVTGVVEDAVAANARRRVAEMQKEEETKMGLWLVDVGRHVLIYGVWGVIGLRRRILLYRPYAEMAGGLGEVVRWESATYSVPRLLLAGIPTIIVSRVVHVSTVLVLDPFLKRFFGTPSTRKEIWLRAISELSLEFANSYVTLNLRVFQMLQQLLLVPPTQWPPLFSPRYLLALLNRNALPPFFPLGVTSTISWAGAAFIAVAPLLSVMLHKEIELHVADRLQSFIWGYIPRPGDEDAWYNIWDEIDEAPDPLTAPGPPSVSVLEDETTNEMTEETLDRATAMLDDAVELASTSQMAASGSGATNWIPVDTNPADSDEENEPTHQTLISFDIEPTDMVDAGGGAGLGQWSAELRSAHEPEPRNQTSGGPGSLGSPSPLEFRITALTMLPSVLATDVVNRLARECLLLPLEALMVRSVGPAYRRNLGLSTPELWPPTGGFRAADTVAQALVAQCAIMGVVWITFTAGVEWWVGKTPQDADEDTQ